MGKPFLRIMVLCTPLMLVACGEGWEAQRIDNVIPYGGARTAGSGVAYVRAKMMPEKELKVEPIIEIVADPVVETKPVLHAEEIFSEAQVKGGSSVVHAVEKKASPVATEIEEHSSKDVIEKVAEKITDDADSDILAEVEKAEKVVENVIVEAAGSSSTDLSAEEYIEQAPKKLESVKVKEVSVAAREVVEEESAENVTQHVSNVAPSVNSGADIEEAIDVQENKVVQPAAEIIAPKKDFFEFKSKGQYDLEDIYSDPFVDD